MDGVAVVAEWLWLSVSVNYLSCKSSLEGLLTLIVTTVISDGEITTVICDHQ